MIMELDELDYKNRRANALGWIAAAYGTIDEYCKIIPQQHRDKLRTELTMVDIKKEWDRIRDVRESG